MATYLTLLGAVIGSGLWVAARNRTPERVLLAVGLSTLLCAQWLVIFGGTTGLLDDVEITELREFELGLYEFLETNKAGVLETIVSKGSLDDELRGQLKEAIEATAQPYEISEGEGNFYGPKIDFHVTDAIGRKWQCATIQLDYQLPRRFKLKYIGADNSEHCPVVIHRAIFGSFERFIALLIEHYAGRFPLWLAPVQAVILPIADRHAEYARSVGERLSAGGLRVTVDPRQEKIGYKIREAQIQKVPYMLVIGDRESTEGTVAVRSGAAGDQGPQTVDSFLRTALEEVRVKGAPAAG